MKLAPAAAAACAAAAAAATAAARGHDQLHQCSHGAAQNPHAAAEASARDTRLPGPMAHAETAGAQRGSPR